jgi:hypothetical protein
MELKCIKENCDFYFESDNLYYEACQLISKRILLDKCYGLAEVPNKKIEIASKVQKLIKEFDRLCFLESWVEDNQIK